MMMVSESAFDLSICFTLQVLNLSGMNSPRLCRGQESQRSRCFLPYIALKLPKTNVLHKLWERNRALKSGVNPEGKWTLATREDVRNKQLQAKMAVEPLYVDRELGNECIRVWDHFGDELFKTRSWDPKSFVEYLDNRIIDAECE